MSKFSGFFTRRDKSEKVSMKRVKNKGVELSWVRLGLLSFSLSAINGKVEKTLTVFYIFQAFGSLLFDVKLFLAPISLHLVLFSHFTFFLSKLVDLYLFLFLSLSVQTVQKFVVTPLLLIKADPLKISLVHYQRNRSWAIKTETTLLLR